MACAVLRCYPLPMPRFLSIQDQRAQLLRHDPKVKHLYFALRRLRLVGSPLCRYVAAELRATMDELDASLKIPDEPLPLPPGPVPPPDVHFVKTAREAGYED